MSTTVRAATLEVLRRRGMTTIFGNPGSTEIDFLSDLPEDFEYVLGLHEGAVTGIATGYAIGTGVPAVLNLHSVAGFGNAISALANAREGRVPLVVIVGQQDRRHIAGGPFLEGRGLERLLGDYAVWSTFPARAQDLPAAVGRAHQEAISGAGPAVVIAPLGDWREPADPLAVDAPEEVVHGTALHADQLERLAATLRAASNPVMVVGAGPAVEGDWTGVVALAERLGCPVWHEPFAGRQGFPHTHPAFAGDLPWQRQAVRDALDGHDLVLAIGTSMLRGYLFDEAVAPLAPGTRRVVITADSDEAHRGGADLAVVAGVQSTCAALAGMLPQRRPVPPSRATDAAPAAAPAADRLDARTTFAALARHLPDDTILVEETPSSRLELLDALPARAPLGVLSNASGALGFGLAGAIGLRMALPGRPVVGVLGDGSAMYGIQALWTATHHAVGVLLIVMRNGEYAVMNGLATAAGGTGPWPSFPELDVVAIASGFGCDGTTVTSTAELEAVLLDLAPTLQTRTSPYVVQVDVRKE